MDDESATEDLVLCQPPGAHKAMLDREHPKGTRSVPGRAKGAGGPMPDLPPRGDIARLGTQRRGATPRRIGRGTLVPSRLTWKPGDPFGEGKERPASRFRWEVMLTSACITAACGLLCVWLLHSIFA